MERLYELQYLYHSLATLLLCVFGGFFFPIVSVSFYARIFLCNLIHLTMYYLNHYI